MVLFNGTLNTNAITSALYNAIISIDVYAKNIRSNINELVNANRVDGTLYGDTKLYTFGDTKFVRDWANDAEGATLLSTARNKRIKQTKITIDTFKIIEDTKDAYLSKQAWMGEGSFSQFHGLLDTLVKETKDIYEYRTYGAFVGTHKAENATINTLTVTVPYVEDLTKRNLLAAEMISNTISNLFDNGLKDPGNDYNELGYEMAFTKDDFEFIWKATVKNYINKLGIVGAFNKEQLNYDFQYTLPDKFFGAVNSSATVGDGSTVRALEYLTLTGSDSKTYEVKAGDLVPSVCTAPAGKSYTVDGSIALTIMHKDAVPYMSGFNVDTEFFNPKGLYTNKYSIFGRNTLVVNALPMIQVKVVFEDAPEEPETPGEGNN